MLTDDEWNQAKRLFLGKPLEDRRGSLENLHQLYALYRSGALSESVQFEEVGHVGAGEQRNALRTRRLTRLRQSGVARSGVIE